MRVISFVLRYTPFSIHNIFRIYKSMLQIITRGNNIGNKDYLIQDERLLEYDIDKLVFEARSPYQKVQIVHSKSLGNLLVLDELQSKSHYGITLLLAFTTY